MIDRIEKDLSRKLEGDTLTANVPVYNEADYKFKEVEMKTGE